MTSSKKKHHPAGVTTSAGQSARAKPADSATRTRTRTPAPPITKPAPAPARRSTSTRTWVIRVVAALAIIGGITVTLIGATPGILGGWGKLGLMVPGMVVAAGAFIALIETTPLARSRRR